MLKKIKKAETTVTEILDVSGLTKEVREKLADLSDILKDIDSALFFQSLK